MVGRDGRETVPPAAPATQTSPVFRSFSTLPAERTACTFHLPNLVTPYGRPPNLVRNVPPAEPSSSSPLILSPTIQQPSPHSPICVYILHRLFSIPLSPPRVHFSCPCRYLYTYTWGTPLSLSPPHVWQGENQTRLYRLQACPVSVPPPSSGTRQLPLLETYLPVTQGYMVWTGKQPKCTHLSTVLINNI